MALGDLVTIWVEALLLVQAAASTVELMDTGQEIAKLEIGKIDATAVERGATLKGVARIVQRNRGSLYLIFPSSCDLC